MLSTSVIFIKLPKVKKHPMGENSPNLVILTGAQLSLRLGANFAPRFFLKNCSQRPIINT
jgi:hypothetical protein